MLTCVSATPSRYWRSSLAFRNVSTSTPNPAACTSAFYRPSVASLSSYLDPWISTRLFSTTSRARSRVRRGLLRVALLLFHLVQLEVGKRVSRGRPQCGPRSPDKGRHGGAGGGGGLHLGHPLWFGGRVRCFALRGGGLPLLIHHHVLLRGTFPFGPPPLGVVLLCPQRCGSTDALGGCHNPPLGGFLTPVATCATPRALCVHKEGGWWRGRPPSSSPPTSGWVGGNPWPICQRWRRGRRLPPSSASSACLIPTKGRAISSCGYALPGKTRGHDLYLWVPSCIPMHAGLIPRLWGAPREGVRRTPPPFGYH